MIRRGIALIVVVGVLGILSMLSVAFVTMARLERKASLQRVNAAKAYLLAKSGIEDAMARLEAGQDATYLGEDWDASGTLNGIEAANEVYRPGVLDTDACPVRQALRPSFFASDSLGKPLLQYCDGRLRGYSGKLAGDTVAGGNTYALAVESQGGFYVNGGDPSFHSNPTLTSDYNTNLRQMLGTLAQAIDQDQLPGGALASPGSSPVSRTDGEKLMDLRPVPDGWTSFTQIRNVALGGSQAKLDALRPYLTLHAWVDKRVIAPNAKSTAINNQTYHSWGDYKLDHKVTIPGSVAPDFERINGKIVGRAPVDLPWARKHRPALIALLSGLKGVYLDQSKGTPSCMSWPNSSQWVCGPNPGVAPLLDLVGFGWGAEILNTWTSNDDCHTAANLILTSTSTLATWEQWNEFCDTILFPRLSHNDSRDPMGIYQVGGFFAPTSLMQNSDWDFLQAKRDILKAAFNPNTDLNKFNPNFPLWKLVDKSDLLVYSTELSLVPVQGQEVTCVGRVLGRNGKLLASRVLEASIAGPSVARISTQREFVCDDLGDPDLPGDETNPRVPGFQLGSFEGFISQSRGAGKTWGHKVDTTPRYPGSWMNGNSNGAALQSYPEPCVNPSGVWPFMNPANYDGNLQLATLETAKDDFYTVNVPPPTAQSLLMLARFDDNFDLGVPATGNSALCVTDVSMLTTPQLGTSILGSPTPNTLYPDGAYSEQGRSLAYLDKGNANGFHGVISFWLKPTHWFYTYNDTTYPNALKYGRRRGNPYLYWINRSNSASLSHTLDQPFNVGYTASDQSASGSADGPYPQDLYYFFEAGGRSEGLAGEHMFLAQDEVLPWHRWELVTLSWDFLISTVLGNGTINNTGQLYVNDGTSAVDQGITDVYGPSTGNDPAFSSDITQDDALGPHHIILGPRDQVWDTLDANYGTNQFGKGADATFDEFAIYDFGGAGPGGVPAADPASLGAAKILASNRYKDGRYYKECSQYRPPGLPALAPPDGEAGSWVSGLLRIPAGSFIQKLFWTWIPRQVLISVPSKAGPPYLVPAHLAMRPTGQDYADIEFLTPKADQYLWDPAGSDPPGINGLWSRSFMAPGWTWNSQEWRVNQTAPGPLRLRVSFESLTPADANTPLLDSPVLDDVSILYTPSGGSRILTWGEGE